MPASAARALPRWWLWGLSLLYILPGIFGRDPWKNSDAIGFGVMWTMAHGDWMDWLSPNIVGLTVAEDPFAYWIGALGILGGKWLGGFGDDAFAARLSTIPFFLLGALSIWFATFALARRSEAQPLPLAFGGQPKVIDYARMLADGAFLIYLGCLGLMPYSHETTAKALHVSIIAYTLCLSVQLFEQPSRYRYAAWLGMALGILGLTKNALHPIAILLGLIVLSIFYRMRNYQHTALWPLLVIVLPLTCLIRIAWWQVHHDLPDVLLIPWWQLFSLYWPSWSVTHYFFKYGIWFAWPLWLFAFWAIYAWRRQWIALHIALPLTFFMGLSFVVLTSIKAEEGMLLPLLPALAILAAFGLPIMKRDMINAIDWFSMMTFTAAALFIWLAWIAKETGWPVQLTKNIYKLVPGFQPGFHPIALVVALGTTFLWCLLIYWRLYQRPKVLWRPAILSSGGAILCWVLLMTLWLPWINYNKSYAGVARAIQARLFAQQPPLSSRECVMTNVGPAQRALFAYFGQIPFSKLSYESCDFLLYQDVPGIDDSIKAPPFEGYWKLLWTGRRPSDRDERFRLYQRLKF